MKKELSFLADKNKRLENFAHMVSHNLRSYTGTLRAVIELYQKADLPTEREEIFTHIKSTSDSLTNTIDHLSDVVKLQFETINEKKVVDFEPVFKNAIAASQLTIKNLNAKVKYDFSKCTGVEYIPAYLQSIFDNLLTNALKYSRADRKPLIFCHSHKDNEHVYLVFRDNGIGIDLERFGSKVFGMYETFHQNKDAKGIGLYITRNQVESLGGSIAIESEVNVGTTFTIRLS